MKKPRMVIGCLGVLALTGIALVLFKPRDEFKVIQRDWARAERDYYTAFGTAKTADQRKAAVAIKPNPERYAERFLTLAEARPDTSEELVALCWAVCNAPNSEPGRKALTILEGGRLARAGPGELMHALDGSRTTQWVMPSPLAPLVLDLAKRHLDHPEAARLLTWVCANEFGSESSEVAPTFAEAAEIIAERFADSPDISNFCETLGFMSGSPPWAGSYERHLRMILDRNQTRLVRCTASFALASVVQSAGEARQDEAEELYQQFIRDFDGNDPKTKAVEDALLSRARDEVAEIRARGVGRPAPEIEGTDLDGRPMTLSDFRGNVVLVSFWATWCYPCMKFIPHERALLERWQDRPFAIVGVNGDTDEDAIRDAVASHEITWRSFRDKRMGQKAISDEWQVFGWPTLYLIDHEGIIRKRWIGTPPPNELDRAVEQLVKAISVAQTEPHTPQPTPDDARQWEHLPERNSHRPGTLPGAATVSVANGRPHQTGFIDKVHTGSDGSESKYVVFLPHNYDGRKAFPAILFLHGAGLMGTDGRAQLTGALAEAIRRNETAFPFVTVFPQAHVGDWRADSIDGRRALAILDEVVSDYQVDAKRISLTGVSMGGEGTWSLAAAHPNRWAAIVPICGGGDPQTAATIKDIPCWCFHGDADPMIRVGRSRAMVKAIKDAGGRPLYHEYPGVGHNCWDLTYANPDLYEWLLLQKRP